MSLLCMVVGHRYSVVHPDKVCLMSMGYMYLGEFAICERCRKKIDNPKAGLPFMLPTKTSISSDA